MQIVADQRPASQGTSFLAWSPFVVAGLALVGTLLSPFLASFFKVLTDRVAEHQRRRTVVRQLQAEFGHVGRHAATNLRRLTELFRTPKHREDLISAVQKMSFKDPDKTSADTLLAAVRTEDLALLPEHLSRDAMRLQLVIRNIEIDIEAILQPLSAFQSNEPLDFSLSGPTQRRFAGLAQTVERCASDSAEIIRKLKSYEKSLFRFPGDSRKISGFVDSPIHFDDANSLREVADWRHWKDEQLLLEIEPAKDLLRRCLGLPETTSVVIASQEVGTINQITKCIVGSETYCMRIRVNEEIFQYERGLVKEAVVALALEKASRAGGSTHDATLAEATIQAGQVESAQETITFAIGPNIEFFSRATSIDSRRTFPMVITKWARGVSMVDHPTPSAWLRLGAAVKRLHEVRLDRFYRTLRDLGSYRFARDFAAEIIAELRARNSDTGLVPADRFEKKLVRFEAALRKAEAADRFVLCHNDLHPKNVFISGDDLLRPTEVEIIDWDNACVHHRYLDFVKARYWSKIGSDGRYAEDKNNFKSFCKGYGENSDDVLKSEVFAALSALWLYRIHMFELRRESGDRTVPSPFPASDHYRSLLQEFFT